MSKAIVIESHKRILSNNLKKLLLGNSVRWLTIKTGLYDTTIRDILNRNGNPTIETISAIEAFYGIDIVTSIHPITFFETLKVQNELNISEDRKLINNISYESAKEFYCEYCEQNSIPVIFKDRTFIGYEIKEESFFKTDNQNPIHVMQVMDGDSVLLQSIVVGTSPAVNPKKCINSLLYPFESYGLFKSNEYIKTPEPL
jgi:hypothetical protein